MKVPEELNALPLYREDQKLLKKWPELVAAWKVAYPGLDVVYEIKKAHAWEVANPERRKKQRGRFLTNWLANVRNGDRKSSHLLANEIQNGDMS